MNKISTLSVALITAFASWAATTQPLLMHVNLKSGASVEYALDDVQDITFSQQAEVSLPLKITLPTNFNSSYVMKVMAGGKQVAEIDQEYIKGAEQQVVIYPCDADGKADLTKGITSKGASVAWDATTKLPTLGEATGDISTFYLVDGALLTFYDGETQDATVTPELLVDTRGTETISYRLVKLGLQYWTADNIRATRFTDGTALAGISAASTDEWNANTTGAYVSDSSEADWIAIAGHLYNGYVAVSDKFAPEGWAVPSCADYGNIRTSIGARTAAIYKDSAPGTWSTGTEGTNLTNMSVVATGYYSTATGMNAMFSDTYIWTSDSQYDKLAKADAIDFFRISGTGTNAVFPTKGLNPHSYQFGHCIRFVRR